MSIIRLLFLQLWMVPRDKLLNDECAVIQHTRGHNLRHIHTSG